jgi:hypothetical protein
MHVLVELSVNAWKQSSVLAHAVQQLAGSSPYGFVMMPCEVVVLKGTLHSV